MIPSAVNPNYRQPYVRVLDNSREAAQLQQLGTQIGEQFQDYRDGKKADALRNKLLGNAMDEQAQTQNAQVDQAEAQQIQNTQATAEQTRDMIAQDSRKREIINNPELAADYLELAELDQNMAGGVMNILTARDQQAKANLAAQAKDAGNFWSGVFQAEQAGREDIAQQLIIDRYKATPNTEDRSMLEAAFDAENSEARQSLAYSQALKAGKVIQLAEKELLTEDQAADNIRADSELALKRERLALDQRSQDFSEAQASQPETPDFKEVQSLRKEFAAETKPFIDINNAYGRVIASAEDPSPAGDMALIFNYMKILDPGSTVREGEFATARSAGSIPQSIVAQYNKAINGQMLEDTQRKDFVNRAGRLFKRAEKNFDKRSKEFERLAKKRGIDPTEVIINRAVEEVPDLGDIETLSDEDLLRAISGG